MVDSELEELLNASGDHPSVRQTHISLVLLTAEAAYKRLKPVQFDFLDFSTREARYVHLASESRLNRRLAPDVYRGLLPLWKRSDRWSLSGSGAPDDWLLQMVRLPDDATLEAVLKNERLTTAQFDEVVDLLTRFFQSARRSREIGENGDPSVLRKNLVENHVVLEAAASEGCVEASVVRRLRTTQLHMLEMLDDELHRRIADGWIRDGHGDLRAEHIYLTVPTRIIDCIAFNHRLRWIDTADDMSFLASDLIRLEAGDWATRLVAGYRERMSDPASDRLLAFYRSYRFAVRAKVAVLRGRGQVAGPEQAASFASGSKALAHAVAELDEVRPWLIAVCGLSGTGKTTVARQLAERIGAVHLASDVIRKELFGLEPTSRAGGESIYSEAANEQTYAEMISRAASLIAAGTSVVLDATFLRRNDREALIGRGESLSCRPLFVECRCHDDEVERRLLDRTRRGDDASDATLDVWRKQRSIPRPYDDLPAADHLVVDTSRPAGETLDEIVRRAKAR